MGEAHKDVSPEQRKAMSDSAKKRANFRRTSAKTVQNEAIQ
jgi:hypothetical protein